MTSADEGRLGQLGHCGLAVLTGGHALCVVAEEYKKNKGYALGSF